MSQVSISKPIYRVLSSLTGQNQMDLAVELATKDLVRLRLEEAKKRIGEFESRYQLGFLEFRSAWEHGAIPHKHTFEVERDFWEWEAAEADATRLGQFLDELT